MFRKSGMMERFLMITFRREDRQRKSGSNRLFPAVIGAAIYFESQHIPPPHLHTSCTFSRYLYNHCYTELRPERST
jgi:hypothetical protein